MVMVMMYHLRTSLFDNLTKYKDLRSKIYDTITLIYAKN